MKLGKKKAFFLSQIIAVSDYWDNITNIKRQQLWSKRKGYC